MSNFNKSLKDYSKSIKQLHGKGKNPLVNLKTKGSLSYIVRGLGSKKEGKPFPLLAQTMSFIFFILVYLPGLVYSCIDPNNAVVKSSVGKEDKTCSSWQTGRRGERELCEPEFQVKKMGDRTTSFELQPEIWVHFGF